MVVKAASIRLCKMNRQPVIVHEIAHGHRLSYNPPE